MDYKKTNAPLNTVTRDLIEMSEQTGNIYETVCVVSKRANQIAVEMKKDLEKKLQEFASMNDNLEEIENKSKSLATMRSCLSQLLSLSKNMTKRRFISEILLRKKTILNKSSF